MTTLASHVVRNDSLVPVGTALAVRDDSLVPVGTALAVHPNYSASAKTRLTTAEGGPFILCDWTETVFIHYQIAPEILQPFVPFVLDTFEGGAYVSLVAFHLKRFRFNTGGKIVGWITGSTLSHSFLNIRTYVHHPDFPDHRGIYFLAEYLPHALNVLVGPRMFGLPYRFGKLDYHHDAADGEIYGCVTAGVSPAGPKLRYRADTSRLRGLNEESESRTLDEFLLERYTAFTWRNGVERLFRVWHRPWPQMAIDPEIEEESLLCLTGDWHGHARLIGGHFSPGVFAVWIGRPQCINGPGCVTVPEVMTQLNKGARS